VTATTTAQAIHERFMSILPRETIRPSVT